MTQHIFYWCRHDTDNHFVESALEELSAHLAKSPTGIAICPARLPSHLENDLLPLYNSTSDICSTYMAIADFLRQYSSLDEFEEVWPKLLVYDDCDSPLAEACRRKNPKAQWGGSIG